MVFCLPAYRIDGFFADYQIKKMGWEDKFELYPIDVFSAPVTIMFSKKNISPEVVEQINQSILELKQNGEQSNIINKYLK
jgi:ABC-type amino acid transport substrate-binding protein